jgi:6-phosphogluconolactonase (cycloisomerase 2 family)
MRQLRVLSLFCALVALLPLAACGGGGSAPPTPPTTVSDFLYESNNNQISILQMDASTGSTLATLTPATGPALGGGLALTSNNFLYAADFGNNAVNGYMVNTSTGALTAVSGSPFTVMSGQGAQGISVDTAGKFLFVPQPNTNQVAAFTINSTGQLTAAPGSPFTTGSFPLRSVVDPSGKYLYVSNSMDPSGGISAYTISSTGALTAVSGSPFTTLVNGGPIGLAVHPNGNFLYIAMAGTSTTGTKVVGQVINTATGSLSPIPGSPFTVGNQPNEVAIDPAGKFLFATNLMDNTVSAFTIDSTSGALTPVGGTPFATGPNPSELVVNKSSAVLYVINANSTSISAFTINSSGVLTAVAPVNGAGGASGLAIVRQP